LAHQLPEVGLDFDAVAEDGERRGQWEGGGEKGDVAEFNHHLEVVVELLIRVQMDLGHRRR
jgi:hypothetical protein